MREVEWIPKKKLKSSVYAIALVENPAMEQDAIYLSADRKMVSKALKFSEEKGLLYTPVLIPNKKIPRVDEATGEEYLGSFSEETVERLAHDFIGEGSLVSAFNSEHNENEKLEGVRVVESWVIQDSTNDKANALGLKYPNKTWMQTIKVDNPEVRRLIKEKKYKAVSIEGLFDDLEVKLNKPINNQNQNEMSVLNQIKGYIDGLTTPVKLSEEGKVDEEKEKMAALEDGEFVLADGRVIRVTEGVVEVIEKEVVEEMAEKKKDEDEEKMASEQVEQLSKVIAEGFEKFSKEITGIKAKLSKLDNEEAGKSVQKFSTKVDTNQLTNLQKFNIV